VPETHTSSRPASVDALELPSLLRPSIEAAIDESEIRGDIPATLHAELRDAGAFRLLTPREFGGSETPLTDVLRIYERFGRIDASVGLLVWNANYGFIGAFTASRARPNSGVTVTAAPGMPELASVRIEIRPHQNVMDLTKACWLRIETCFTASNLGRDRSSVPVQHGPGAISIAVNSFR
jgi:hypothetical protein